jgi:hypothetical protein
MSDNIAEGKWIDSNFPIRYNERVVCVEHTNSAILKPIAQKYNINKTNEDEKIMEQSEVQGDVANLMDQIILTMHKLIDTVNRAKALSYPSYTQIDAKPWEFSPIGVEELSQNSMNNLEKESHKRHSRSIQSTGQDDADQIDTDDYELLNNHAVVTDTKARKTKHLCEELNKLGSFQERVRKTYIRFDEVIRRNNGGFISNKRKESLKAEPSL